MAKISDNSQHYFSCKSNKLTNFHSKAPLLLTSLGAANQFMDTYMAIPYYVLQLGTIRPNNCGHSELHMNLKLD